MVSTIGFAQNEISGFYSIGRVARGIDCNLYLYNNGNYYIELSEFLSNDIVFAVVLSYGKFLLVNKEVMLVDEIHNFKIRLVVDNKALIAKQAFSFLVNKRFIRNDYVYMEDYGSYRSDVNPLLVQKEHKSYNISHNNANQYLTLIHLF